MDKTGTSHATAAAAHTNDTGTDSDPKTAKHDSIRSGSGSGSDNDAGVNTRAAKRGRDADAERGTAAGPRSYVCVTVVQEEPGEIETYLFDASAVDLDAIAKAAEFGRWYQQNFDEFHTRLGRWAERPETIRFKLDGDPMFPKEHGPLSVVCVYLLRGWL